MEVRNSLMGVVCRLLENPSRLPISSDLRDCVGLMKHSREKNMVNQKQHFSSNVGLPRNNFTLILCYPFFPTMRSPEEEIENLGIPHSLQEQRKSYSRISKTPTEI